MHVRHSQSQYDPPFTFEQVRDKYGAAIANKLAKDQCLHKFMQKMLSLQLSIEFIQLQDEFSSADETVIASEDVQQLWRKIPF